MKNKTNGDIRQAIERAGIRYWQVAEAYGTTDGNFSRKLRKELPAGEKAKLRGIIDKLKEEREGQNVESADNS